MDVKRAAVISALGCDPVMAALSMLMNDDRLLLYLHEFESMLQSEIRALEMLPPFVFVPPLLPSHQLHSISVRTRQVLNVTPGTHTPHLKAGFEPIEMV